MAPKSISNVPRNSISPYFTYQQPQSLLAPSYVVKAMQALTNERSAAVVSSFLSGDSIKPTSTKKQAQKKKYKSKK